jgi:hypothetical protein
MPTAGGSSQNQSTYSGPIAAMAQDEPMLRFVLLRPVEAGRLCSLWNHSPLKTCGFSGLFRAKCEAVRRCYERRKESAGFPAVFEIIWEPEPIRSTLTGSGDLSYRPANPAALLVARAMIARRTAGTI